MAARGHRVDNAAEVRYQPAVIENSGDCAIFRGKEKAAVKGAEKVHLGERSRMEGS